MQLRGWRLAIIGGLLILLMVATAACDDANPSDTVEHTPPLSVDATDVEE